MKDQIEAKAGGRRLNFGSGSDYREGWINLDVMEENKWISGKQPDVFMSITDDRLPFPDGYFDYVLADNVLEHVERSRIHSLLLEFHRVLSPGGALEIWVPHFTGIGVKYLEHIRGYGINSFWFYARYFVITQELLLFSRSPCTNMRWPRLFNTLNPIFNLSTSWQQCCEKYLPGGFEEIRYFMVRRG